MQPVRSILYTHALKHPAALRSVSQTISPHLPSAFRFPCLRRERFFPLATFSLFLPATSIPHPLTFSYRRFEDLSCHHLVCTPWSLSMPRKPLKPFSINCSQQTSRYSLSSLRQRYTNEKSLEVGCCRTNVGGYVFSVSIDIG